MPGRLNFQPTPIWMSVDGGTFKGVIAGVSGVLPSDYPTLGQVQALIGGGGSGSGPSIQTVTTGYTIQGSDDYILASGALTVTCPSGLETEVTVKNIGNDPVVLSGVNGMLIDGSPTQTITYQYNAAKLVTDGSAWWLV